MEERAFLCFVTIITGEDLREGTEEEIAAMRTQLGEDLTGIKDDVVRGTK
jgi:hypothetical protein